MARMLFLFIILTGMLSHVCANEILRDNFDRDGKLHGSQSSDGKYTWSVFPRQSQNQFIVKHDRMNFNATGGVMYVGHKNMRQRDFDLVFDFTYLSHHYARSLSVNYRIQGKWGNARLSDGGHTDGYVLYIERPSRSVLRLRLLKESTGQTKPETLIAKADVITANRWGITTRIHLQVNGAHHRVFINNARQPIIDAIDDEFTSAGWWNIADGALTGRAIDNLSFSAGETPDKSSAKATVQRVKDSQQNSDLNPLYPIHYTGRVTPTPQQVLSEWELLAIDNSDFKVEIAHDAHNAISLARDLLLHRVVVQSEALQDVERSSSDKRLTIYLGKLESEFIHNMAIQLKIDLKNAVIQPHGYVIRRKGDKILAAGVDHRGTFYAAMTLYQSIGAPKGKLILRNADLNDWPVWNWYQSTYTIPNQRGLLWMAMHKIPGISLQQRNEWRNIHPDGRPQYPGKWKNWKQVMRNHKEFNDRYDLLDRQLLFNIYAARPRKQPMLDITNRKHIAKLIDACTFAAEMGIDHIMIAADDWTPAEEGRFVSPYPNERQHFNDSVGRAHGILMKQLHATLKQQFPDLELSFVPAPYSIYSHGIPVKPSHQRYLRDLAEELPSDVYLVWTGPKVRSHKVTRDDFLRWEGYVGNQRTFLWDNNAGPELIKRWETAFYEGFAADSQGIIFINGDIFGKTYRLAFTISSSDYLWNPKAYQADQSFLDAVEKMYGTGTAVTAERFVSVYAKMKSYRNNPSESLGLLNELDKLAITMKHQGWAMRQPIKTLGALRAKMK